MLEATRTRISFSGEVLTAALFLAATLVVGLLIVRELRAPAASPAPPSASAISAVPSDGVSVPSITFGAHTIKVGDTLAAALSRMDASITQVKRVVENGPLGARDVRAYEVSGLRFVLVAEPFERGGEARVSAIYLQ